MPELRAFQSEFFRSLLDTSPRSAHADAWPDGFAVYRNTALKGLIDALAANYPTIERLVGREWFAACAGEFIRARPPSSPVLALYGMDFPKFLADFGPAAELPYLPDVARIDRLWTEAHFACDAPVLRANTLARCAPEQIFEQRIDLHPAARFGWFNHSAVTIWLNNRPPAQPPAELEVDGAAEGILLTRPTGAVAAEAVNVGIIRFLASVRDGSTLGAAAIAAVTINENTHFAPSLARLISAGAFAEPSDSGEMTG